MALVCIFQIILPDFFITLFDILICDVPIGVFCPDLHWVVCTFILIEYVGIYIMNISSSGVHVLLISSLWLAFSLSMMFLIKRSFKLYWNPIYQPFIFMVTVFRAHFKISLPIPRLWDRPVFSSRTLTVFLSYLSLSISKIIVFHIDISLHPLLKTQSFHFWIAVVPLLWTRWPHKCGLEKEMATHSSILSWKISWTEEPGGLQPMGSQRVGHDWATYAHISVVIYGILYSVPSIYLSLLAQTPQPSLDTINIT